MFIESVTHDVLYSAKNNHSQKPNNLSKDEIIALNNLKARSDLDIREADKGGGIVIRNKLDYIKEAQEQLDNQRNYCRLNKSPASQYVTQINGKLNDLASKQLISDFDKKTMAPPIDANVGNFYTLPKIHKVDLNANPTPQIPGRPIVSNIRTPTENISRFLNDHLKSVPQTFPSYVKDTPDFLRKIDCLNESNLIDNNALLVTLDVSSLYTNIPKQDGLKAIEEICYNRNLNNITLPKDATLTLLDAVLSLNAFEFNGQIYQQIHGTSMGTPVAPTYSNIFMGWLEQQILDTFTHKPIIYLRYLDDIFIIWTHGKELLDQFITHANQFHPTIKFTANISDTSLPFLDTLVSLNETKLSTTLYKKPTDKHQYLHYESHHPRHCKNAIPYSQIVRLRRLCMDDNDYDNKVDDFLDRLKQRNYPDNILKDTKEKAKSLHRPTTLEEKPKKINSNVVFVTSFSSKLNMCNTIMRKHFHLIKSDPKLCKLFKHPPKVVYRRNNNFKQMLTHNKISQTNTTGCKPCNDMRCLNCRHMQTATYLTSTVNNFKVNIKGNFNCKSANVIYCIECAKCNKQYIGETRQEFHKRMTAHRHDITHKIDTAVSEHFNLPNHSMNDVKTYIIGGGFAKNRKRKYKESFLISKFQSQIPLGINRSTGWLNSVHCIPYQ